MGKQKFMMIGLMLFSVTFSIVSCESTYDDEGYEQGRTLLDEEKDKDAAVPQSLSFPTTTPPPIQLVSTWQPWEWTGYEKFPSLYFAAEPEGYMNENQMDKVSKFSLAILEFRMGQFVEEETTGKWAGGDIAGFMEEQVLRMKNANLNAPPILVYRSGMWAGSMFAKQWDALQNQELFISDERQCDGFISYPMDINE